MNLLTSLDKTSNLCCTSTFVDIYRQTDPLISSFCCPDMSLSGSACVSSFNMLAICLTQLKINDNERNFPGDL